MAPSEKRSELRPPIHVRLVLWADAEAVLSGIRRAVFIEEQQVPEALEWDEWDAPSVHALAETPDGVAVGTARLLPDGRIGRMAVLEAWRQRGIGHALLHTLISLAHSRGDRHCRLAAQVHALGFYARAGFVAEGPVFDDAGIPHREMVLSFEPGDQSADPA